MYTVVFSFRIYVVIEVVCVGVWEVASLF